MEKTLKIVKGQKEIEFEDLDHENEMAINVSTPFDLFIIYLDRENLISLQAHISYLLSKK